MFDIQRKKLNEFLGLLNAWGAKYAIVIDDEKFGDLEVAETKSANTNKRTVRMGFFDYMGHKGKIPQMKVGEVLQFQPDPKWDDKDYRSFRGCLSSEGKKSFGLGSTITTGDCANRKPIEIMRVK